MTTYTIFTDTKKAIAGETVTRIIGEPEYEQVERLQEECAEIANKFEMTLIAGVLDLGHIAMVVDQATYRIHSRGPAFVYVEPARPGAFDDTIPGTAGNVLQQRRVAEHKKRVEDYEVFRGVKQGLREKILFAVDG